MVHQLRIGERRLVGTDERWEPLGLTMQVANVSKVLRSVRKTCDAGNMVVFDNEGSYVMNKRTGATTKIWERNGVYEIDLWVEVPRDGHTEGGECGACEEEHTGREESSSSSSGFARQGVQWP